MKLFRFLFGSWPGRLSLLSVACAVLYVWIQRKKRAEALRQKQIEKNRQESQRLLEEQKKKKEEEQKLSQQKEEEQEQSTAPSDTSNLKQEVQPNSSQNAHSFLSDVKTAPNFEGEAVVEGAFKKISLTDYKGKNVLLCFYPRDYSNFPFDLLTNAENFRSLGCEVIFCNRDSKYAHFAWINLQQRQQPTLKITTPLLSDLTSEISTAFGFDESACHLGVFLISGEGKLVHSSLVSYGVVLNTDALLQLVQSLQN